MKLVIAEKPSVGRTIASVLGADKKCDSYYEGNGYIISWAVGHLVALADPKDLNPDDKWKLDELPVIPEEVFVVKEGKEKQFGVLKSLMERSDVDTVVCATDAGREGELIFRYIYDKAGCRKPYQRLWVSSLTDEAIKEGFANLQDGANYENLYQAALKRNMADQLVGLSFTRLFSILYNQYQPPLSVGRVQTPTLYMLVKREKEIAGFIKEKYYKAHILCNGGGVEFDCVMQDSFKEKGEAEVIGEACRGKTATVIDVKEEIKYKAAPRLFDLTSLQREANKLFGYTAKNTLDIVQELYEAKLCTYPRTDSQYITDDMEHEVSALVDAVAGTVDFLPGISSTDKELGKCVNNKKVSDHHAIIPTGEIAKCDFNSLSQEKCNILLLICSRLLCAVSKKYAYKSTKAVLRCEAYEFAATGRTVVDSGYRVYEDAFKKNRGILKDDSGNEKEEKELPSLASGMVFENVGTSVSEHETKPPQHYTEASLLAAMETAGKEEMVEDVERKGLGTSATRAETIETLVKRGYIERVEKKILPTKRGTDLISVVPDDITSPSLTAEWENMLAQIAKGQYSSEDFFSKIVDFSKDIVTTYKNKRIENNPFPENNSRNNSLGECPNCGKEVKNGKYGIYCTGTCGMNVGKVFGKALTEKQCRSLLDGKPVKVTFSKGASLVLSEIEPYSFTNKDGKEVKGYQWKVQRNNK